MCMVIVKHHLLLGWCASHLQTWQIGIEKVLHDNCDQACLPSASSLTSADLSCYSQVPYC